MKQDSPVLIDLGLLEALSDNAYTDIDFDIRSLNSDATKRSKTL
jgi:hypothetical protein